MIHTRRVALIVLYDGERVLLQHRSDDASRKPGFWAFFGGGIEQGETPEQAVRREMMEELQVVLDDIESFERYEFAEEGGVYEKHVFLAPLTYPVAQLRAQQQEGQGLGMFSADEVKNLKISKNDIQALDEIFKKLKNQS